jgi:tryptophanyl-tRNA synthetase
LKGIAPADVVAEVKEGLEKGGMGYGTIKKLLLQAMIDEIREKREKYNEYLAHYDDVEDMLRVGASRARELVRPVLERAKDAIFAR